MERTSREQAPLAQQFALLLAMVGAGLSLVLTKQAWQSYGGQDKYWEFGFAFFFVAAAATGLWTTWQVALARATSGGRRPRRALVVAIGAAGMAPMAWIVWEVLSGDVPRAWWLVAAPVLGGVTALELVLVGDLDRS